MSNYWEGIEDSSEEPHRVWFSKGEQDGDDQWMPLRKCDCAILNEALKRQQKSSSLSMDPSSSTTTTSTATHEVTIEFGRATADLTNNVIRYNFYHSPKRLLSNAIWYKVDSSNLKSSGSYDSSGDNKGTAEHSNKIDYLIPITSRADEELMENLYKEGAAAAVASFKSFTKTEAIEYYKKKEVDLIDDDTSKLYVVKSSNKLLRMRKKSKGIISLTGYTDLQRGYGDYVVDGEKEECALGPVKHLSFVVHGIGEAMWKKAAIAGLIDEINFVRATATKKLYADWMKKCKKCRKAGEESPPPPSRIEFIPIEWYEQIHSSSSSLKKDLLSATINTIPKLRSIANDVIFDVLVYSTQEFCGKVLNCVTEQICDLYEGFQKVHPNFVSDGGTCSLVGHSLGSVIAWDILSILSDNQREEAMKKKGEKGAEAILETEKGTRDDPIIVGYTLPERNDLKPKGYEAYLTQTESNLEETEAGTWGPPLLNKMSKTIPFIPSFTFFLGSPIGLFLTLRGARPVFNSMQNEDSEYAETRMNKSGNNNDNKGDEGVDFHPTSPFRLPSNKVYNIFSQNDPVAYRIEPLLLPTDFPDQDLPPPCFLVPGGQELRFHVKVKEVGDTVMKSVAGLFGTISSSKNTEDSKNTPAFMRNNFGLSKQLSSKFTSKNETVNRKKIWKFALGGDSDRVDYQLQPAVVENEYLAAISAHNTYLKNDDLLEFWIECACESSR